MQCRVTRYEWLWSASAQSKHVLHWSWVAEESRISWQSVTSLHRCQGLLVKCFRMAARVSYKSLLQRYKGVKVWVLSSMGRDVREPTMSSPVLHWYYKSWETLAMRLWWRHHTINKVIQDKPWSTGCQAWSNKFMLTWKHQVYENFLLKGICIEEICLTSCCQVLYLWCMLRD